ncbi:MAG: hypothetical protein DLM55_07095 [Acidimicrobiales bacterium]|nr:MAG: hypothetical protein DLM55_07095 [Acidimicrobiales bacterium]
MSIPAGWYSDPAEPEIQRFWDGEQWADPPSTRTEHITPAARTVVAIKTPELDAARETPSVASDSTPAATITPTDGSIFRLASHASRLAARMVDISVLFVLNLVVNGWFLLQLINEAAPTLARSNRAYEAGNFEVAQLSDRADKLVLLITIVSVALWLAYEVPALLQRGQTPGKRLLGIRVIGLHMHSLRPGAVLRRWAFMGLPLLFPLACSLLWLAVDGAWCLKDRPSRQCLHDKAARTVVVDV